MDMNERKKTLASKTILNGGAGTDLYSRTDPERSLPRYAGVCGSRVRPAN